MTRGLEQRLAAYALAVEAAARELAEYQRQHPAKYRRVRTDLYLIERVEQHTEEGEAA